MITTRGAGIKNNYPTLSIDLQAGRCTYCASQNKTKKKANSNIRLFQMCIFTAICFCIIANAFVRWLVVVGEYVNSDFQKTHDCLSAVDRRLTRSIASRPTRYRRYVDSLLTKKKARKKRRKPV